MAMNSDRKGRIGCVVFFVCVIAAHIAIRRFHVLGEWAASLVGWVDGLSEWRLGFLLVIAFAVIAAPVYGVRWLLRRMMGKGRHSDDNG